MKGGDEILRKSFELQEKDHNIYGTNGKDKSGLWLVRIPILLFVMT